MEYSIKLRVHGVPSEGQQIWGADIAESYVENFYGRKSSVLAQLIVEIIPSNGINNYYYTYYCFFHVKSLSFVYYSSPYILPLESNCISYPYSKIYAVQNIINI